MERDKQEMEVMERERQGQCAKGFMRLKQKTKSANEKRYEFLGIPKKLILSMETDGAQGEAPQCLKLTHRTVSPFKELNLDALIHDVNAASLLTFNPVERQITPLPLDLAGVILSHDQFGSHLDVNDVTVDAELKKLNLQSTAVTPVTI